MRRLSRRRPSFHLLVLAFAALAAVVCAPAASAREMTSGLSPNAISAFTPGDLVVYRVGDPSDPGDPAGGSGGAPVDLDEYSPSGQLVESIPMPTTQGANGSTTEYPLVAAAGATSEGELTLSGNGQCLLATGYDAATGTTGLTNSVSATTPRTVAVVNAAASVDTSTALTDFSTGNNPRSATSSDCSKLWVGGAAGGVESTTVGATTGTSLLSSTYKNVREVQVVDGQLYTSSQPSKSGLWIASIGSGLPTTAGQTPTNLNYSGSTTNPYGYALLTTNASTTSGGPDTLYVADNTVNEIEKYNLIGGTWTAEGDVALPTDAGGDTVFGLTANDVNGTVEIYATTGDAGGNDGQIYNIADASQFGQTMTGTPTQIASAASGQAFRGIAFAPGTTINAAPALTPGDLMIYRVGDGTTALTSNSAPVFLDEYSPSGTLVKSVQMPTAPSTSGSTTEYPLVAGGTSTSEGELNLSANGQCVLATGYDEGTAQATPSGTTSAAVPRTVGLVNSSATVDTSTALTNWASGNNPRSATSSDCSKLWLGGAAGGVGYATDGASTDTQITSSTDTNFRDVQDVDGQLYASADPTKNSPDSWDIASVGTGLPTTATQSLTKLTTGPTEPYQFALLTTKTASTSGGPDTLYVADNSANTVEKYNLISGTWTAEGSVSFTPANTGDAITGLTANDVNGTVDIYFTSTIATKGATQGTDGQVYAIADTSGFGNTMSGTATKIATAATNETFRGISFAPGTTIGSGPAAATDKPIITPAYNALPAAADAASNPTLPITVAASGGSANANITLTASSSNTAVAPTAGISLTQSTSTPGAWTLAITPGTTGSSTITLTATAPDGATSTTTIAYAVSPAENGLSGESGGPFYYDGAGNASTEISVGGGYFIVGDDLSNVLRLYNGAVSGEPVATYDFTSQLPFASSSNDIEAAVTATEPAADCVGQTAACQVIYWFASESEGGGDSTPNARDTVFATEVIGSGPTTQLEYLGAYSGLQEDLINWDKTNNNVLGLNAAAGANDKSTAGFNIEGAEFAPGSTSEVYLAFRAPLEPYASDSSTQDSGTSSQTALLVPLNNLPALMQTTPANEQSLAGLGTFSSPIELNLNGLGIRELRENAAGQYLLIGGTSGGSNSIAALYTWDGVAGDPAIKTRTTLPVASGGDSWAWEGIAAEPSPFADGGTVELVQDDGDQVWYGNSETSKSNPAIDPPLQKDLGANFALELASQTVAFTSTAPAAPMTGQTYTPTATASSGLTPTLSIDASSTSGACSIASGVVSFTGAGTCIVDANQAGNYGYDQASPVQQSITVAAPSTNQGTTTTQTTSTPVTTATVPVVGPGNPDTTITSPVITTTTPTKTTSFGSGKPVAKTVTHTATTGNQKITVTVTNTASACLATTSKLAVDYKTAAVKGSKKTKLTLVKATVTFNKKLAATIKRQSQNLSLSVKGLKKGTYSLKIVSEYRYKQGSKTRTVEKTQTVTVRVC